MFVIKRRFYHNHYIATVFIASRMKSHCQNINVRRVESYMIDIRCAQSYVCIASELVASEMQIRRQANCRSVSRLAADTNRIDNWIFQFPVIYNHATIDIIVNRFN